MAVLKRLLKEFCVWALTLAFVAQFLYPLTALADSTPDPTIVSDRYLPKQTMIVSLSDSENSVSWSAPENALTNELTPESSLSEFGDANSARLILAETSAPVSTSTVDVSDTGSTSTAVEVSSSMEVLPEIPTATTSVTDILFASSSDDVATSTDIVKPEIVLDISTTSESIESTSSVLDLLFSTSTDHEATSTDEVSTSTEIIATSTEAVSTSTDILATSSEPISSPSPATTTETISTSSPDSELATSTDSASSPQADLASTTPILLPPDTLKKSSYLEFYNFNQNESSFSASEPLKDIVARVSLGASAHPKGKVNVEFSSDGNTWQTIGTIDASADASNFSEGDFYTFKLPITDITQINSSHLRLNYEAQSFAGNAGDSLLNVDALWVEARYQDPAAARLEADLLEDPLAFKDPQQFDNMELNSDKFTIDLPGDLVNPITVLNKNDKLQREFQMKILGAVGVSGEREGNAVVYKDAATSTDFKYEASDTGLKESIILKDGKNPGEFKYLLNTSQYDFVQNSESSIDVYAHGHAGDLLYRLFTLSAPKMTDANGETTDKVGLSLKGDVLTLTPDKDWLKTAAYPVVVDPTVDITIINVVSHPVAGEFWKIDFTTVGTSTLTVTPADQATIDDMQYSTSTCDGVGVTPEQLPNGAISFANWSCDGIGEISFLDLHTGHHHMIFNFGGVIADAYNGAKTWDGGAHTNNWEDAANWNPDGVPAAGDDVLIDIATTTNINASTTINSLTLGVSAGGTAATLNFNYDALSDTSGTSTALVINNNLTIYSGASVTHSVASAVTNSVVGRVNMSIGGNATVTGSINADAKGWPIGHGPGSPTDNNSTRGSGASYGGIGTKGAGTNGASPSVSFVYGSSTAPIDLGSGGGQTCSHTPGTSDTGLWGGGAIKLNVSGTLNITGSISANGSASEPVDQCWDPGAGSGGSIWINTATLSGGGTVSASGAGSANYEGGGGGRIALYYTTDNSTSTLKTYGGTTRFSASFRYAGAGTIFKKTAAQSYGDIIIDNNGSGGSSESIFGATPLIQNGLTLDSITATSSALFYLASSTLSSVTASSTTVNLRSNSMYDVLATSTLTYSNLNWTGAVIQDSGGSIQLLNQNQDLTIPTGSKLISNIATSSTLAIRTFNNVTINGTLTHTVNSSATTGTASLYKINYQINGNLTLAAGGTINTDYMGFVANQGPGAGLTTGSGAAGASYGGIGGAYSGLSSSTYGSTTAPTDIGSGGGTNVGVGGAGGGAIILNVTGISTINGTITSNGANGTAGLTNSASGGSGGSVYIVTGTLAGSGSISTNGGAGGSAAAGPTSSNGGGGRIAVYYTTDSSTITYSNHTSSGGGTAGGAGTLFKKAASQTYGDLILDNNGVGGSTETSFGATPLYDNLNFDSITATSSAYFYFSSSTLNSIRATTTVINILGNALYDALATSTLAYTTLNWTGGMVRDSGGSFTLLNQNQDLTIPTGSKLIFNVATSSATALRTYNNFTVNGTLTHTSNSFATTGTASLYKINYQINGNLTLAAGGTINTDLRGFVADQGPGAGRATGSAAAGASYGGMGGIYGGLTSSPYGSTTAPTDIGSGGGTNAGAGGSGGGAIILNVTGISTINGTISSGGGNGTGSNFNTSSGGTGGSVYIVTGTLAGSGSISTNGGAGAGGAFAPTASNGGGGRIAVYYTTDSSTITYSNHTSSGGGTAGGAGTLFKKAASQAYGDLILDNNNVGGTATSTFGSTYVDGPLNFDNLTLRNSAYLNATTSPTYNINGNLVWANSFASTTITAFKFIGSGNQTITATTTLPVSVPLIINGTGTTTLASRLNASSTLTVSGGTFDANGTSTTITGLTTVSGGIYLASSTTQTLNGGFTVSSGAYLGGTGATNVTGNFTFSNGTSTFSSGALTVSGNFNHSGGIFTAPTTNFNLAGDFARSGGTFTANSGSVVLNGNSQNLTGTTTFYNLTKTVLASSTLAFGANQTQTISNTLTLGGASNSARLELRSNASSTQWKIDPQNVRTLSYLDVQDSNNINSLVINAANTGSIDQGDNTNWIFISPTFNQEDFRWYQNADAIQPATALAAQDTSTTITSTTSPLRLRMNQLISNTQNLPANYQGFKLQVATSTNTSYWADIGTPFGDSWYNTSWSYRRKITFNNASSTTDLVNFPVLVTLNATSSGNIDYAKTKAAGADIRFTDSSGTSSLSYEIEKWDPTATSTIWVKVPILHAASGADYIYMYYDNPAASDNSTTTGVWDSNFKAVWHMGDNSADTIVHDSSANSANGTSVANTNTKTVTGESDGALSFNGSNDYVINNMDGTTLSNATVDFWVNPSSTPGSQIGLFQWANALNSGTPFMLVARDNTGNAKFYMDTGYRVNTPISNTTWSHIVMTLSGGTTWKVYINGSQVGSTYVGGHTLQANATSVYFGNGFSGYFTGNMDEARISSSARSADYILAEYKSESNTLNSYGSEESTSSSLWNFYDNPSVTSSSTISSALLSTSNVLETYQEGNPTSLNPNGINTGQYGEYDWSLHPANISANTTYYFRMVKNDGTVLDNYVNYPSLLWSVSSSTVHTASTTNITSTDALAHGSITALGTNSTVLSAYGFVWNTSPSPTLTSNLGSNTLGTDTSPPGSFSYVIPNLSSGHTYYVRSYATNEAGTTYGEEDSFSISAITLTQKDYQFFANADSLSPGSSLGAQSTITAITSTSSPIRLRMNLQLGSIGAATSTQVFKLQVATSTSGVWTDVAATHNWYNTSWQYRRKITFDNSASSENLTNFPILVSLNATNTGNVDYSKTKAAGADIRFTDSDGTTLLNYEIEKWDTTGTSTIWVKVPQIDGTSTTDFIYIYYDNPTASDNSTTTGVWDSNFKGVFHLPNGSSLTANDSTSNGNNGTVNGATAITGMFDGGANFNGSQSITRNSPSFPTGTSARTAEVWFKLSANTTQGLGGWGDNVANGNRWDLWYGASNTLGIETRNGSALASFTYDTNWHHLLVTSAAGNSSSANVLVYIDGQLKSLVSNSGNINTTATNMTLGTVPSCNCGFNYTGSLDEFRASSVARSSSWVLADYKTESGTFQTYGAEETPPQTFIFDNNASVTSSSTISSTLLTSSNKAESYQEGNSTEANPSAIYGGQAGEWDFALDPASTTNATTYYFRMVKNDGTALDSYTNYPALTVNTSDTAPNAPTSLGPSSVVNGGWINTANALFSFSLSDPDIADTVGYEIQVATDSSFLSLLVDYVSGLFSQGIQTFTVGQAAGSGSYSAGSVGQTLADTLAGLYWRVRTFDISNVFSSFSSANSGAVAFKVDATAPIAGTLTAATTTDNTASVSLTGASDSGSGLSATPYIFYNITAGTNSGATTSTSWTSAGLSNGTAYTFRTSVTDTAGNTSTTSDVIVTTTSPASSGSSGGGTLGGGGGIGGSGGGGGGGNPSYRVLINDGDATTTSSLVTLTLIAPLGTPQVLISNTPYFYNSVLLSPYKPTYSWNLCDQGVCQPGTYGVYAKYYNSFLQPALVATDTIYLADKSKSNNGKPPPDNTPRVILTASTDDINFYGSLSNLPLGQKIYLKAVVNGIKNGTKLNYAFDCQNDGIVDEVFSNTPRQTVISDPICSYNTNANFFAKVSVSGGNTSLFDQMLISTIERIVTPPPVVPPPVVPPVSTTTATSTTTTASTSPITIVIPPVIQEVLDATIEKVTEVAVVVDKAITNAVDMAAVGIAQAADYFGNAIELALGGGSIIGSYLAQGLFTISKSTLAYATSLSPSFTVLKSVSTITIAPVTLAAQYAIGANDLLMGIQSISDIYYSFIAMLQGLLSALGIRKRRRYWGTVYDAVNKQPLDPAIVELISMETGQVVEQSITDIYGRFGFLDRPGKYYITAKKTHYKFPSDAVAGIQDGIFHNIYHGEIFNVLGLDNVLAPNIPMDPMAEDWNQLEKERMGISKINFRLDVWILRILKLIFWVGFGVTMFSFMFSPSKIGAALAAVYAFLIWLNKHIPDPRLWGRISSSHISIDSLLLELHVQSLPGVVFGKTVTNAHGKFFLKASPGKYSLVIKQIGGEKNTIIEEREVEIGRDMVLNQNIELN